MTCHIATRSHWHSHWVGEVIHCDCPDSVTDSIFYLCYCEAASVSWDRHPACRVVSVWQCWFVLLLIHHIVCLFTGFLMGDNERINIIQVDLKLILASVSKLWRRSGRAVSMLDWRLDDVYSGTVGGSLLVRVPCRISSPYRPGHTLPALPQAQSYHIICISLSTYEMYGNPNLVAHDTSLTIICPKYFQIRPILFKLHQYLVCSFQHFLNYLDIFIITEVIPFFVLGKRAIFWYWTLSISCDHLCDQLFWLSPYNLWQLTCLMT